MNKMALRCWIVSHCSQSCIAKSHWAGVKMAWKDVSCKIFRVIYKGQFQTAFSLLEGDAICRDFQTKVNNWIPSRSPLAKGTCDALLWSCDLHLGDLAMHFKAKLGFILSLHTNVSRISQLNFSLFSCNTKYFHQWKKYYLDCIVSKFN